jgi:shikimate dehydrogenase
MRLFGLIGNPLAQSFSKKYFTEKFEKQGIVDCRYELFELKSIEALPQLLKANPELAGLNVTIPYKQQVVKFLDSTSHLPNGLDACNCIRIDDSGLSGFNTDVAGFQESFSPQLKPHHKNALILGNGGATVAVIHVLQRLGIAYHVVSRELKKDSHFTYRDLNEKIINDHQIIINTTPLGSFPKLDTCPPVPYQFLSDKHYLFDVVYNPPKSLFLKKGEDQGAIIKNGYDWLVVQAEESWRIWNEL